jgi:hypothetical protein
VPSPSGRKAPARRQGDLHALEIKQRLDALERRVDDLLLVARVVLLMLSGHAVLQVLDVVS